MNPQRSSYRILDANLNRASEGLRVVEDVCRFHWNLPGFARELKALRHALLAAAGEVAGDRKVLLESRNIEGDVGREGGDSTPDETAGTTEPTPLSTVAFRNLQRTREAIRAIEETCRSLKPALIPRFEGLRYQLYSVEKGLGLLGKHHDRGRRLEQARLYLVASERLCRKPFAETVTEALEAGVDIVQMREKDVPDRELLHRASLLRELTARAGALFVVNDRPAIALLAHADGLHLGQEDLPLYGARAIVGDSLLIGCSTHSLDEARRAAREGADYIGVGPVFTTSTKDAGPPLGPEGLRSILRETSLPAFAIGGVSEDNLSQVVGAGARRVAIASAILSAEDVAGTVRRIKKHLGRNENDQ